MNDREFKAAIIRPPMAYGGGMAPGKYVAFDSFGK